MMQTKKRTGIRLRREPYLLLAITLWTLLNGLSLWWNNTTVTASIHESAKVEARTSFKKDIVYRRWNALHKGVYVPITPQTPPNPRLKDTLRDVVTTTGMHLTKMNPAYMTRQVHELARDTDDMWGHITSLNPIRPGNKADTWETDALKQFDLGKREMSSIVTRNGKPVMRLMRPMTTEKSCLECHGVQGYKQGDIRGGISVGVPLVPYIKALETTRFSLYLFHLFVWALGISVALLGSNFMDKQVRYRLEKNEALGREQKVQGRMEMAATVSHELNQPLQVIAGNIELLMMDIPEDAPHWKRLTTIKDQTRRMGDLTLKILTITREEVDQHPQGEMIRLNNHKN